MTSVQEMSARHCEACRGGSPMDRRQAEELLPGLPGWQQADGQIYKTYTFPDYHQTMAFVNAVAWIAHREDHHPDLEVSYSKCTVRFSTHKAGGLTENDFICAAKVEALLA